MTTLVWFRDDLRLADHAALAEACLHEGTGAGNSSGLVALYVLDEESAGTRPLGGAAKWWLHGSLTRLSAALAERGIPLILRRGACEDVVSSVVQECAADRVFWNRRYGDERHHDARIKAELRESGVDARSFQGGLLFEPWHIATGSGDPYRVYSPFWRACLQSPVQPAAPLPEPAPGSWLAAARQPTGEDLDDWGLLPTDPDWAQGIAERWTPGEQAANEHLKRFLARGAADYSAKRDFPAEDVGSELSPYLRWGEISPRTVWHRALDGSASGTNVASGANVGAFLSELGWREFAWHTTFHRGALHRRGLDARFDTFPWRLDAHLSGRAEAGSNAGTAGDTDNGGSTGSGTSPNTAVATGGSVASTGILEDDAARTELAAWRRGETGFGLVDAGMRELWISGFMHNRVRMVVASFLTKNLLVDWRIGEAWFWDTLVDADAASNPFNWQWVAGCGADAAPYFRVFNPATQQQKFDQAGHYVNLWAPDTLLHPEIVDLKATRLRALAAYDEVRGR